MLDKLKNLFSKQNDLEHEYVKNITMNQEKLDKLKDKNNKLLINIDQQHKENIVMNVLPKPPEYKWWQKVWIWISGRKPEDKVQGYIFYLDKNYNLTIYNVIEGFDNIFKIVRKKYGEAYMLHKYIGLWNNKRFFIIKFPHAVSLELFQETYELENDDQQTVTALAYDSVSYYNLLEHTIKRNITLGEQKGPTDIVGLIKEYWLYIIVIIVMGFLFFTPQGKQIVTDLIGGFSA